MSEIDDIFQDQRNKLADFGLARVIDNEGFRDRCGTVPYMAPEVLIAGSEHLCGLEADVWNCGVVLHHMLTGEYPFYIPSHTRGLTADTMEEIQGRLMYYEPPDNLSLGAQDLLRRSLALGDFLGRRGCDGFLARRQYYRG
jgi:serine/threonine protein kinase